MVMVQWEGGGGGGKGVTVYSRVTTLSRVHASQPADLAGGGHDKWMDDDGSEPFIRIERQVLSYFLGLENKSRPSCGIEKKISHY